MRYAEGTTVPVERSRAEIERILVRYGASHFGSMLSPDRAVILFVAHERQIRFVLPMPRPDDRAFTHYQRGQFEYERTETEARRRWEQGCRVAWRALALAIKAKLEAVESRISTFESEFLAHIVLPDGQTVGEHVLPAVTRAYATGKMPPLLLEAAVG